MAVDGALRFLNLSSLFFLQHDLAKEILSSQSKNKCVWYVGIVHVTALPHTVSRIRGCKDGVKMWIGIEMV